MKYDKFSKLRNESLLYTYLSFINETNISTKLIPKFMKTFTFSKSR